MERTSQTISPHFIPSHISQSVQSRQNPCILGQGWSMRHARTVKSGRIINRPSFPNLQLDKSILKTTSRFEWKVNIHTRHKEKRLVLSETDLNKSSTLMHDYDTLSHSQRSNLSTSRSDQIRLTGKLQCLGHTSISMVLGS